MTDIKARTVFFDIGGVLLSNGWENGFRKASAEQFNIDFEEMEKHHKMMFFAYEIGAISLDEYLDTIVFHTQRDFSKKEFIDYIFSCSLELPDMLQWLKEWKKKTGVRIISINNEAREVNNFRIQKFGLKDCFDAFISSGEVGLRKPDSRIFKLALGVAQSRPQDCLYFDDQPLLVKAANQIGIKAFHHNTFEHTKNILEQEFGS